MKDHIEAQLLAIKQRIAHEHSNGIDQTPEINQTLEKELLSLSDEELSQMEAKEDAYFQAVQEDLLSNKLKLNSRPVKTSLIKLF